MKKLTLFVLTVLFLMMMVSCVDYSAMRELSPQTSAGPTASAEPMVQLSAYEQLLDDYNALNEKLNTLTEAQNAKDLAVEDMTAQTAEMGATVSDVTLSVYRSVISKDKLGAFFGMVTNAEKLGNGDVVLTVQPLNMVNEAMDASLYDENVIKQIYEGITLEASAEPTKTFTIFEGTMVAYDDKTHMSRDTGFYTYVVDEMAAAKATFDAQSAANTTLLEGPVFIFLAIGDDVIMVLEK